MARPHSRPLVLVTGASTGLGLALARRLIARDRYRLLLTARETSLPRFAAAGIAESAHITLRRLDVVDASQREALIAEAETHWGGVDVLVNNAGVAVRAVVEHGDVNDRIAQMHVNFVGPMELIRLCLPSMRKKRAGRIVNVSSVGGMMAMPTMAIYSASKFALEGATEALWYEVRPWNIKVSLIQPGFINSSSFEKTRFTKLSLAAVNGDDDHAYAAHYEHMGGFIERMMHRMPATPDTVARTLVRTIERRHPPLRVPATLDASLFAWLRRLLPRRFYHWLLYRNLPGVRTWGRLPPAPPAPPAQ